MDNIHEQWNQFKLLLGTNIYSKLKLPQCGYIPSRKNCVSLLVIPHTIISTKDLFMEIDLGRKQANSWFLKEMLIYDLMNIPTNPYILTHVNVRESRILFDERDQYEFEQPRHLTLHEVVTLAFAFPGVINTKRCSGIQAYGSRYTKGDEKNPFLDDTLEVYGKGNPGHRFAKLAREVQRYIEYNKIIPYTEREVKRR